ncbi:MAG: signal peptidase I [Clostridia bacterium]|nr:signal peptidase I [Clostridia bacterium]
MKKLLGVIKNVFVWAVVALAVCMMIFTIVSVTTFDRNDRNIFGFKAFIVLSDSMSATDFEAGDIVLIKEVDPSTLKEGDIISYQSINDHNYGQTVTHKIRRLVNNEKGEPGFITYGTTTGTDDESVVTYSFVLGKYQGRLPKVGKFFQFLKTTPGYILCIFIPFLLLIIFQGINSIKLFKRYKEEQLAEMRAEREAIEEERRQSQELMKELMELKAKLGEQIGVSGSGIQKEAEKDDGNSAE